MRSRYHPFHPHRSVLYDTLVGCVVNGSTYCCVQHRRLFFACRGLNKNPNRKQRTSLAPFTRENGSDYSIHRNGSKASSSSVLTGSHHPPALWKARNDYYSSSQPLLIFAILEKAIG